MYHDNKLESESKYWLYLSSFKIALARNPLSPYWRECDEIISPSHELSK